MDNYKIKSMKNILNRILLVENNYFGWFQDHIRCVRPVIYHKTV